MYSYTAKLGRVVDGDTVWLEVDLGFHMRGMLDFRLHGLNAPETVGAEKAGGAAAKAELERLLGLGPLRIETSKSDKYGRWLAKIYVTPPGAPELSVNQAMIDGGFAVVYMP